MDEDAAPSAASADGLSKKQKKKLAKKLKNDEGTAVTVTETVTATATVTTSPESKKKGEEKKDEKKEKKKEDKPASAAAGETKTLDGGLVVQDTKVGTGKMSKKGNTLSMRYIGKLEDGKIFDSNTKGAPVSFPHPIPY
jgi:FK506-binding nuclear protein